jgi:hypothetical protein
LNEVGVGVVVEEEDAAAVGELGGVDVDGGEEAAEDGGHELKVRQRRRSDS